MIRRLAVVPVMSLTLVMSLACTKSTEPIPPNAATDVPALDRLAGELLGALEQTASDPAIQNAKLRLCINLRRTYQFATGSFEGSKAFRRRLGADVVGLLEDASADCTLRSSKAAQELRELRGRLATR